MDDRSVARLVDALRDDPWRAEAEFSPDMVEASAEIDDAASDVEVSRAVNTWIGAHQNQPCLFGRIAARQGLLSYSIVTDELLDESDEVIQAKIQADRERWTRDAFFGRKSGFIVYVKSSRIARAMPDETMMRLAQRLCLLYLREEPNLDQVLLEQVFLEKPGADRRTWRWYAGVNYFCAQGDKRWWHDHRIPSGMAFSVNSVGHLVKSGLINKAMTALNSALNTEEEWATAPITSLEQALSLAMRTIWGAAETVSGKATELIHCETENEGRCPIALPTFLADRSYHTYLGRYHTDHTIPSVYFRTDIRRPIDAPQHELDLTYLWDRRAINPAHETMGEGIRIRTSTEEAGEAQPAPREKQKLSLATELAVENCDLLKRALTREAS